MNECLDEGVLQAYLDGELLQSKADMVAVHLGMCLECGARMERIQATAAHVNAMLDSLEVGHPVGVAIPNVPVVQRTYWRVAAGVGALAIAAALILAVASAHHAPAPAPVPVEVVKLPAPPQPAPIVATQKVKPPARPRRARARKPIPPPAMDDFLVLDDADPLQVGVVVRVKLPASAFAGERQAGGAPTVLADLVIDEDGRARAIRFVP